MRERRNLRGRHRSELGCQLGQAIPEKPLFQKQSWQPEHYERLLNVEFDRDPDHLSNEPPLEGPPIPITIDMVKKAISKMKSRKAAGPSGIVVEMIKAAGDAGAIMI